jgi:hypothetical protein
VDQHQRLARALAVVVDRHACPSAPSATPAGR